MPDSNLPPGFVLENDTNYTPLINAAGDKYGIDPNLIRAHMDVESGGDPNAVSPQGAGGLMQIMPDTARSLGVQDRFRPYDSINGAAKLMRQNYDRYGTPYEAIAAYHGGTDTSQWGPRTHDYVGKVMDRWQHYKEQTGQAQPRDQPPPPGFVLEDRGTTGQQQSKPQPPQGLPQRPPGSKPFDLPAGEREQAPQSYKAAGLPPAARDEGPALAPRPPADQTVSDVDEFGTPLSVKPSDSPQGRIIGAALQGVKEGFGPQAPGMDPTTEQTMRNAGVFPSDQNGGPLRQLNEAIVKPLWSVGDAAVRGVSGAFRAGQSAVAQTGQELAPYIDPALNKVGLGSAAQLGRDIAAYPESRMGDMHSLAADRASARQSALNSMSDSARDTLSQVAKGSKTPVLDAMAEKAREANNLAAAEAQTPKAPVGDAVPAMFGGQYRDGHYEIPAFHGTSSAFDRFAEPNVDMSVTSADTAGKGIFFGSTPEMANGYADGEAPGMNVRPSLVRMKNPKFVAGEVTDIIGQDEHIAKSIDSAKAAGHDGIVFPDAQGAGNHLVVAFSPDQVSPLFGRRPQARTADNIPTMTIHPEREEEAPAPPPVADTRSVDPKPVEGAGDVHVDREAVDPNQKPAIAPGEATSEADYGAAPAEPSGKATPFEKEPKEPLRLSKFLAQPILRNIGEATERKVPGGLQDEGGEVSNILGGKNRRPGFINKNGRTLEDAAQAAWEAGYFPGYDSPPPASALLDALRDDVGGKPQYSHHDAEAVDNYHATLGQNAEIDRLAQQYGIDTKGLTRDQFFDQVHERASADERADHEASLGADWLSDERAAEQEAVDWVAYHGTPHDFDAFDTGRIGTGEGAQAYGHGLYFAENEGVARSYQNMLSSTDDLAIKQAKDQLKDTHGDFDAAIEANKSAWNNPNDKHAKRVENILRDWKKNGVSDKAPGGNLFSVKIRAKPDEMLDWDKPLSEQPKKVQEAVRKAWDRGNWGKELPDDLLKAKGEEVYNRLTQKISVEDNHGNMPPKWYDPQAQASKELREAGLRGIHYFDNNSRDKGVGTRNVVVFDHNDVDITHKNGVAVPKRELTRKELYGQSQARTLEDLEREHQQITAATGPLEHAPADVEPGHARERSGAGEEGVPQERGAVGDAGRGEAGGGEEAPGQVKPSKSTPEPTIRNDPNQVTMPGMEPSARQAQAARDAAGPRTDQKPADEGLFAKPEAEHAGLPLYGGLPMLDPNAWKFMASPLLPHARKAIEAAREVRDDAAFNFVPMSTGSTRAQAFASDFANHLRQVQYRFGEIDREIAKNYSAGARDRMGRAMDAQSVFEQQLLKMPEADRAAAREAFDKTGEGVAGLPKKEQHAVDALAQMGEYTWREMQKRGMVDPNAKGLPYYFARQIMRYTEAEGFSRVVGKGGSGKDINKIGKNLSTNGPMKREHLTPEETEAAARAKLGDDVSLLRDIRSLPNRLAQMHRAIAGHDLMKKIEDVGKATGVDLVVRGDIPDMLTLGDYFTIAGHPAFRQFTGTGWRAIHVASEFEGPLKAVLTAPTGKLYQAAMKLKGGIMRGIMFSPLMHLNVELGRAGPILLLNDTTGTLTFRSMRSGSELRRDLNYMDVATRDGLAPLGRSGWKGDPATIAQEAQIKQRGAFVRALAATRDAIGSGIEKGVGSVLGKKAGEFAKDAALEPHQTMLWDQVFNLQVGLYDMLKTKWMDEGYSPEVAGTMAAHIANRYAGAVPSENLSRGLNMAANMLWFSRSFSAGNIGVMKDVFTGAPSHTLARIEQMAGRDVARSPDNANIKHPIELMKDVFTGKSAQAALRRKAISAITLDIIGFYMVTGLFQAGIQAMREGVEPTEKDLMDKAGNALDGMKAGHIMDIFKALPQHYNEPGKQDRIYLGLDSKGRGVYARTPLGKVGEEFIGWPTHPGTMLQNKSMTWIRPTLEAIQGRDSSGKLLYPPNPQTLQDNIKIAGLAAYHILESQGPTQFVEGLHDLYMQHVKGEKPTSDPWVSWAKVIGPLSGLGQISYGYPGGPEAGVMHAQSEGQTYKQQQAMPEIRKKLDAGDLDGAVQQMTDLGIPPGLMRYYVQQSQNPGPTKSVVRRFNQTASPDDRDRLEKVTH